jgi:hypothetical protein
MSALIAVALIVQLRGSSVWTMVRSGVALVLGIVALFPIGVLFDAMGWPLFHSWALAHGSFFVAIPVAAVVAYAVLGVTPWFKRRRNGAV